MGSSGRRLSVVGGGKPNLLAPDTMHRVPTRKGEFVGAVREPTSIIHKKGELVGATSRSPFVFIHPAYPVHPC